MLGSERAGFGSFGKHARNVSIAKQSFLGLTVLLAIVAAATKASENSEDSGGDGTGAAIVAVTMSVTYVVLSGLCLAAFIMACIAISRCR